VGRRSATYRKGRWLGCLALLTLMPPRMRSHYQADQWAASIALATLWLQAQPEDGARSNQVSLNEGALVNYDAAAAQLADFAKPVACTASLDGQGRFAISCTEVTDLLLLNLMNARRTTSEGWERQIRTLYAGEVDPDPLLSVRSRADTLAIPLSGLRRYLEQYLIQGSVTLRGPDAKATAAGACAIVRLHPPNSIEVENRF
jgi:hypothetical protein